MTSLFPFIEPEPEPEFQPIDIRDRWPGYVAVAAALGLAFFTCFHRVWATDVWWQYKAGEYINQQGWPTVDVFSFALRNEPWVELRWLFCLGQYWLMNALGPTSLIVAKMLTIVSAFFFVTVPVLRRDNRAIVGFVLSIAVLAASLRFLVRPEIVSWWFAALFALVLHRYRRGDTRFIWLLPLLQIAWVNSHTLFIFGPLLVGLALFVKLLGPRAGWAGLAAIGIFAVADTSDGGTGGLLAAAAAAALVFFGALWLNREIWSDLDRRREVITLVAVLVAAVAVCLINPWGVDGFMVPFDQFLQISDSVYAGALTEYQSPFSFEGRLTSVLWYEILLALVVLSALVNLRRLDSFWLLFCASQLYLSTIAIRNVPLFCLAAVPFVVSNVDRSTLIARISDERVRIARQIVAGVAALTCIWYAISITTDRYSLRQRDSNQFGAGFAELRYPVGAVEFLDRNQVNGRVYATLLQAAYVLAHDRRIFADPRGDVYPNAKFAEFLRMQSDPAAWQRAVEKYDIRVVVADLRSPVIATLGRVGGWSLVYFDGVSAVLVRGDALRALNPIDTDAEFHQVLTGLRDVLPTPKPYEELGWLERATIPNPYLALSDFLYTLRRPDDASVWLEEAASASPFLARIDHRRVAIAELRQDWPEVVRRAPAALEETPDDAQLHHILGIASYLQQDLESAKRSLSRASALQPNRASTWAALGDVAIVEQDFAVAVSHYAKAAERAPGNAAYRNNLARAKLMSGDVQGAFADLQETLRINPNNVGTLHDLAQLYINSGDAASARVLHERAWALSPEHPLLQRQRQALIALEAQDGGANR